MNFFIMIFCLICSVLLTLILVSTIFWRRATSLQIKNRAILITGCDTGFGNLLAKCLDGLGASVYAGCLLHSSIVTLNRDRSKRFKAFLLDVADQQSLDEALCTVEKDLNGKPLWAIVNNAAVPAALVPFDWCSADDYSNVLDVNFIGIVRVTLAFLPLLKRGKGGRIINVSSMNGRLNIMSSPYGISKCALEALSDGLSMELKPFNITVHTLQPSMYKTKMSSPEMQCGLIQCKWESLTPEIKTEYGSAYLNDKITYVKSLCLNHTSSNLSEVIAAFEHALFSKYPKNRYVIGLKSKLFYLPLSWLPFPLLAAILPLAQKLAGLSDPIPACMKS